VRISDTFRVSSERLAGLLVSAAFVLAIGFLGFVVGSYVMLADAFPSGYLTNAYRGGQALLAKSRYDHPYPSEMWQPARTDARGVTIYDPDRAHAGYTLYTSGHAQTALLISMAGEVLHEWHLPYSEVWDASADAKDPRPDTHIYYRKAHVYPNGDLLAIYIAAGDTPWGYGLVKMDKDSRLIWKYLRRVHHDLDIAEDGSIYTLTHEIRDNIILGWEHLKPPRIDDFLVVLSPDGQEIDKISIVDAFVGSPYARMVNQVAWYSAGDFFHTNSVDLVDEQAAEKLSGVAGRQVLLSMRELGAIGLLDLNREVFTWALRGPWVGQHDPDLLPSGNTLLFDNFGHFGSGGISRVIEFDPRTMQIVWQYAGDERRPFYSNLRSAQERLGNGNTLITESDGGRLFEVAPDGEIVWEFINPVRGGDADEFVPVVSWGQRIDPTQFDPTFLESLTH
jgi:outer membrane protein assembly factor BamB